jgi:HAD superfamily hydrolase (TIGR01509 family)
MSIETLVFDIGNVLVPFDWQAFRSQLQADRTDLTAGAEEKLRELAIRMEVGEMTGEMFIHLAVRTIGYQGDEKKFLSIWNGIFRANPAMERTILDLKKRFPLCLLSNTSDIHLAYLLQNFDVLRCFVDGVYSFRANCAKPDRKIFQTAIKQFGLCPEKTAYIDDLPANVRSASDLGFKAIRYDLNDHAAFEQRLAELGIEV